MQTPYRFFPTVVINEIVPVGNVIVHRASRMAEGHATLHATRTLLLHSGTRELFVYLKPVLDAFFRRTACRQCSLELHEPSWLTHAAPPWPQRPPSRAIPCIALFCVPLPRPSSTR